MLEAAAALRRAAGGGTIRHAAYLAQAIRLKRRCDALGITHVHAHFSTNAAAVAMLCRRLGGPRYSFTVHGPDELDRFAVNSLTEKALHAQAVVAISDYCRDRLRAHLPESLWGRIRVIPCGVDLRAYPAAPPPPSMSARLLSVGRLCPQKAQVEIPAAIAAAAADHPELSVALIGDGESRAAIEQEIRRTGTGGRVKLLGWRSNAEVRRRIGETRALLLPSHAEGLPIVIMEAFALGRPVIATRIAGIPELVDERCGWLVEPGTAPASRRRSPPRWTPAGRYWRGWDARPASASPPATTSTGSRPS
ncbi:glycosyltransferase family 4 protein [Rhizorhabdus histidinilytica]